MTGNVNVSASGFNGSLVGEMVVRQVRRSFGRNVEKWKVKREAMRAGGKRADEEDSFRGKAYFQKYS